MKDFDKIIRKDATTVLLMVVLFIVYYFVLIAIGIALFAGAIWVTFRIPNIILGALGASGFYGVVVVILAFAAMWWFCIQIGWFLIKPLFLVQKSSREGLLEIKTNMFFYHLRLMLMCPIIQQVCGQYSSLQRKIWQSE